MGAFGELLIKSWGGDLDRYRGNYESKSNAKDAETTEEDKARFRYEYKISQARRRLEILTSNLIYRPQDVNLCSLISLSQNKCKHIAVRWGLKELLPQDSTKIVVQLLNLACQPHLKQYNIIGRHNMI